MYIQFFVVKLTVLTLSEPFVFNYCKKGREK